MAIAALGAPILEAIQPLKKHTIHSVKPRLNVNWACPDYKSRTSGPDCGVARFPSKEVQKRQERILDLCLKTWTAQRIALAAEFDAISDAIA